jgi:Arc/MetJ family transcription regulator
MQSFGVMVLRAVYVWSERHYRREALRQALWRISREMAAGRAARRAAAQDERIPEPAVEANHGGRVATS